MGDWVTCPDCGEEHPVAELHECPTPRAREAVSYLGYLVRIGEESHEVPMPVGREIERLRKAAVAVCTLYETACREEDPNDPESEWDENDPDGHGAVLSCFRRAEGVARQALSNPQGSKP